MSQVRRKSIRLQGYDYSQYGWYFVTVCTKNMIEYLGEVGEGKIRLNEVGEVVQRKWMRTPQLRPNVELDEFVVMPNHLHGVIVIKYQYQPINPSPVGAYCNTPVQSERDNRLHFPSQTLGAIIRGFKSSTTKQINTKFGPNFFSWHRNYFEHIIRNDQELGRIRNYIANNPNNWDLDDENPNL